MKYKLRNLKEFPILFKQNVINMDDVINIKIADKLKDIGYPLEEIDGLYNRPTFYQVFKWLREVHNKHIQIALATNPRKCFVYFIQNDKGETIKWNTDPELIFDTYEEALEVGLQKALELI